MKYRHPLLGAIEVDIGHWDKECAICGSIATLTFEPKTEGKIHPPTKAEITLCAPCRSMLTTLANRLQRQWFPR